MARLSTAAILAAGLCAGLTATNPIHAEASCQNDTRSVHQPGMQASAAATAAQRLTRAQRAVWNGLDRNGDGYIAGREAAVEPQLFACFEALDRDADNRLSPTEFARFRFIRSG